MVPPSGSIPQINEAQAVNTSSETMPAEAITSRCRLEANFQASLVSVYNTGSSIRKATPMVGTRHPCRTAAKACPSS
ncbi:MAG: hypothetical protein HQL99_15835 [Magnetococcales bacterium]|nr:hypothetical protein [Magnetococcales bacterium]